MAPSVGKKLSLVTGILALISSGAVGYVSYESLNHELARELRENTLDVATLLSSRIRNELRHAVEKGRLLTAAASEEFREPKAQIRFLEENLALDPQYVALSLFRHSEAREGRWISIFRLTRPPEDPAHLSDSDFNELDLKYPIDLGIAGRGEIDIAIGKLSDDTPIVRMAVPIARRKDGTFSRVLGIELRQERITAAFSEATAHLSFLLDRNGRLLAQSDPTHFSYGEDLSHLPILQVARTTETVRGNLDYREVPGASLQYGSFHKMGYADLVIVSQASRYQVNLALRALVRKAVPTAMAFALFAALVMLVASRFVVGWRLAKIGEAIRRARAGRSGTRVLEKARLLDSLHPSSSPGFSEDEDEIGEFARILAEILRNPASTASQKPSKAESVLAPAQPPPPTPPSAFVIQCSLRGTDELVAHGVKRTLTNRILGQFRRRVSEIIHQHQGFACEAEAETISAAWGIPSSPSPAEGKASAENALKACIEIRHYARSINENLQKRGIPPLKLAIGADYGPTEKHETGSGRRKKAELRGDAPVRANQIHEFAPQFSTEILLTSTALGIAPPWFTTEKVAPADGPMPEIHELTGEIERVSRDSVTSAPSVSTQKQEQEQEMQPEIATEPALETVSSQAEESPEPILEDYGSVASDSQSEPTSELTSNLEDDGETLEPPLPEEDAA